MHAPAGTHWRTDIQGLRAVAVLGVVLFHAGVPWLDGGYTGVDVFFVISGFLITQNLLRERAGSGTIRLGRFFVGRLVRLGPAAAATVLCTVLAVHFLLPPLDRTGARTSAWAALFGAENLKLAATGTDYLAAHAPSPFQQFWSLGVEEQFYVGWALVLALLCSVPVLRRVLLPIAVLLFVLSFVTMIVVSDISGPWAFFGVHTRTWELGAGALTAIVARSGRRRASGDARLPRWAGRLARPVGLLAIVVSYVGFDEATPFPSAWTLLPVLGAVLVVAPLPADRTAALLSTAPLRWLGDRSYSLYLWHWPVLLLPTLAWGRPLRPFEVVAACAVTVALGWSSHLLLERWTSHWARRTRLRPVALVAGTVVVAAAVAPLTALPTLRGEVVASTPSSTDVLGGPRSPAGVPANLTPAVASAEDDLPALYADGCHAESTATAPTSCTYGDDDSSRTIVLLGDSHAAQWFTPVVEAADASGARVVPMTKSACPAASIRVTSEALGREYRECDQWRAAALERIAELEPDLVVLSSAAAGYEPTRIGTGSFERAWEVGLRRTMSTITERTGARILLVHDTPRWEESPNRCLSGAIDDVGSCARSQADLHRPEIAEAERRAVSAVGGTAVDPFPWLCTTTCSPVVWNVLAYRDADHITDTVATVLTPRVAKAIGSAG